jgi:hypothetical protein
LPLEDVALHLLKPEHLAISKIFSKPISKSLGSCDASDNSRARLITPTSASTLSLFHLARARQGTTPHRVCDAQSFVCPLFSRRRRGLPPSWEGRGGLTSPILGLNKVYYGQFKNLTKTWALHIFINSNNLGFI